MVSSWAIAPVILLLQEGKPMAQVERKHDVSALLAVEVPSELAFNLAPTSGSTFLESDRRAIPLILGSDLVELLTRVLKSSGVKEEFKLDAGDEDGVPKLDVVASSAVQQEVDRLLRAIEAALYGTAELEVRVLALEGGASLPEGSLTLDAAEAERRESELVQSKRARLMRVGRCLPIDGLFTTLTVGEKRPIVDRYAVEIGLGPIHYQPVVDESIEGLTAEVRSARLIGATSLELALHCQETVEPVRALTVEPTLWYVEPRSETLEEARAAGRVDLGARMFHGKVPIKLDLPRRRFVSLAGSFILPDGKTSWIPCRVATKDGTSAWLVVVRMRGSERPLVVRLSRDGDARQIAIVDVAALESWSFSSPNYSRFSFDDPAYGHRSQFSGSNGLDTEGRWPSPVSCLPHGTRGPDLPATFQPFELAGVQAEAVLLGRQCLLVDSQAVADKELRERFAPHFAPPAVFEVQGRILRAGAPVAEFRLPLVGGSSATLWSGFDGAALRTWMVDVADISQVGEPLVAWHLDGFALTFVAAPIGTGRIELATRGVVSFVDAPPTSFATGNPETPIVERVTTHRLLVSDVSTLVADATPPPIVIGGSSCSLEVTVVAR